MHMPSSLISKMSLVFRCHMSLIHSEARSSSCAMTRLEPMTMIVDEKESRHCIALLISLGNNIGSYVVLEYEAKSRMTTIRCHNLSYFWSLVIILWQQILLCSSFSPSSLFLRYYSHQQNQNAAVASSSSSSQLHNTQLNTNLESLFEERYEANKAYYQSIQWHDPSQPLLIYQKEEEGGDVEVEVESMPLYPLGATYLPTTNVNHTLNNVEPRNIQMALDLLGLTEVEIDATTTTKTTKNNNPVFCAVLSAADTGRIALVGTVLEIIDYQIQTSYDNPKQIAKIQLTCQANGIIVDICNIANPEAFSKENRIKRSSEYLKAKVVLRRRQERQQYDDDDYDIQQQQQQQAKFEQLIDDFAMLKLMYQLDLGMSKDELPPGALRELGNAMPSWEDYTIDDDKFWNVAQDWQSVLYTIRQGRQSMLNAERNERMIAAATEKGGPLKLPVHMEDLDPHIRREIQEMENQLYTNYLQLGLDPCLDFQAIISQRDQHDRIDLLLQMISRERRRVEISAKQPRKVAISDDPDLSFEF